MIYVVDDREVTHYVGINWAKAVESAKQNSVFIIRVWRHGKLIMHVDSSKNVWWVASHLVEMPYGFKLKKY